MKKYVAEWEGKKIILTGKDYATLLMRFDRGNFQPRENVYYNKVACPLCKKYISKHCDGCTFNKFYKHDTQGCVIIINQICKKIKVNPRLNLCSDQIIFDFDCKYEATKIINYVKRLLITRFQLVEE